jgi:hypothetical protein
MKNVNLAEFQPLSTGAELRQKIWAIGMGGAYSMILFMDIASTPVQDLEICGRLVAFMEATRFNETSPHDALARGYTDYVLANPGTTYIAYGDSGDSLGLAMEAGNYMVRWYDPVSGLWEDGGLRDVTLAGNQTFVKPLGFGAEAALYLDASAPGQATTPYPSHEATHIGTTSDLDWWPGVGVRSHDVYLGLDPGDLVFQASLEVNTYSPGLLNANTTYFWRIDEVNEIGTTVGVVWQFATAGLPGDTDGDGDSDQEDFGRFQVCFSQPGVTPIPDECLFADMNGDELVDQSDLVRFQACMSAANVPVDPACVDD